MKRHTKLRPFKLCYSEMTDFLEAELVKHIFRTGSFTKPTVLAFSLATATIVDSDTGATITEVADSNAYARVDRPPLDANWSAPGTGGLTDNVADIAFTQATGSWGTVTDVGIASSVTHGAGDLLMYSALDASKAVGDGDTFKFAIGDLDVTFA